MAQWKSWGRVLGVPLLVADGDGALREPFRRIGRLASAHPRRAGAAAPPSRAPAVDPAAAQARRPAADADRPSRRARDHRAELNLTFQNRAARRAASSISSREQDQAGVAVGAEHPQARVRIVDVDADDLPGKMRRKGQQPEREHDAGMGGSSRRRRSGSPPRPRTAPASAWCSRRTAARSISSRPARRPRGPDGRRSCRSRSPRRSSRRRAETPATPARRAPRPSPSARPRRTRARAKSAANR